MLVPWIDEKQKFTRVDPIVDNKIKLLSHSLSKNVQKPKFIISLKAQITGTYKRFTSFTTVTEQ